ncbi:camk camk-unique protein kinase [Moniliophthora roreri MCA 2997]|uniref:Camk camk-unique protein kinase n=2 Tax=Moniliophthora roreri TaxID=221103 RepID=V2XZQ9_MONRO|nr:camk camk-unique protein kinase [Moniliophthora roreri MCA 2997]
MHREHDVKERIVSGEGPDFACKVWRGLRDARSLITQLLQTDPCRRATVQDALTSAWVQGDIEVLEGAYHDRILSCMDAAELAPR